MSVENEMEGLSGWQTRFKIHVPYYTLRLLTKSQK